MYAVLKILFTFPSLQTITGAMSTINPPVPLEDSSNQFRVDYIQDVASQPDFGYPSVSTHLPAVPLDTSLHYWVHTYADHEQGHGFECTIWKGQSVNHIGPFPFFWVHSSSHMPCRNLYSFLCIVPDFCLLSFSSSPCIELLPTRPPTVGFVVFIHDWAVCFTRIGSGCHFLSETIIWGQLSHFFHLHLLDVWCEC